MSTHEPMDRKSDPKPWHRIARTIQRRTGTIVWVWGGSAALGLIVLSCSGVGHQIFAPPAIPGAEFVGMEECEMCHEEITRDFKTADHARLQAKGPNAPDLGCEGCHGPGSLHVESGGEPGTIINPDKSPDTCFQCHLNVRAQFNLPYAHPVLSGKMSCSDCHDPHKGSAIKGGGTQLSGRSSICFECHSQQQGPFVFEHEATRGGCSSCHSPHGSPNQKMLTERNATLCLKCHFQDQERSAGIQIGGRAHDSLLSMGTCWTAGCHEGVHGSNASPHLHQ